jgi:hypothetical protein
MVRESQENMLFLYWKWFYPYILEMRSKYYPEAWILIDYMMFRWRRAAAKAVVREYAEQMKHKQLENTSKPDIV